MLSITVLSYLENTKCKNAIETNKNRDFSGKQL